MEQLKTLALLAIALFLAIQLWSSQVRPQLYLNRNVDAYRASVAECSHAMASLQHLESAPKGLSDELLYRFNLSVQVELVACHESERLRSEFLSKGVRVSTLDAIYAEALEASQVPLAAMATYARIRWQNQLD